MAGTSKRERRVKLHEAMDEFRVGFALLRSATTRSHLERALKHLDVAVQLRPTAARYFSVRGNAYRALGEYQRAFFDYSAASRIEPRNALHHCNRGIALRKLCRYREALADLAHAGDLDPANGTILFNRGLVLFEMGDFPAAAAEFQAAIASGKQAFKAHFNLANAYRRMNELDKAIAELQIAVNLDPEAASGHNSLGLAQCEKGLYDEAETSFTMALERAPRNSTFLNNRGLARYHMGDLGNAIEDLDNALKYGGQDSIAYFHRGNALLAAGKPLDALGDLTMALALCEEHHSTPDAATRAGQEVTQALASTMPGAAKSPRQVLAASRVERAAAAAAAATSRKPTRAGGQAASDADGGGGGSGSEDGEDDGEDDDAAVDSLTGSGAGAGVGAGADAAAGAGVDAEPGKTLHDDDGGGAVLSAEATPIGREHNMAVSRIKHSLGLCNQELSQHERALGYFLDALAAWPGNIAALYHAGLMHHALRRPADAERCFTQVLDAEGPERRVFEARGLALQQLERHDEAMADFAVCIEMDAARGEPYFHRAVSELARRNFAACVADLDKAVENGYKTEAVFDARADAHKKLGDVEAAVEDYTGALLLAPDNPDLLCKRSQCYRRLGEFGAADTDLTAALQAQPKNPYFFYLRGLSRYDIDLFQDAVQDLQAALSNRPPADIVADCHYHVGLALANSDRHELAVQAFRRALERAGADCSVATRVRYLHERAKSNQMAGDFAAALGDFTAVLELNPDNPHALFRRAFAFKSVKKYDRAAEDFERARFLDPENPYLVVNYSRLHELECVVLCAAGEEPDFLAHPPPAVAELADTDEDIE